MGFARLSPPQGLKWIAVWDRWRQGKVLKRVCGPLLRSYFCCSSFVPLLSGGGGRVFEEIEFFTTQEMKRGALDCAATMKSTVSVLKLIYAPRHAQTACKKGVRGTTVGIGRTFWELPLPHSSSSDDHHFTAEILLPPRFSGSQTSHGIMGHHSLYPSTPQNPLFFAFFSIYLAVHLPSIFICCASLATPLLIPFLEPPLPPILPAQAQ